MWKVVHAQSPDGGDLAIAVSKVVTRMVCVITTKKNDNLTAQCIGTKIRPVLLKAFAKRGARDFLDKYWLDLIHEGKQQGKN